MVRDHKSLSPSMLYYKAKVCGKCYGSLSKYGQASERRQSICVCLGLVQGGSCVEAMMEGGLIERKARDGRPFVRLLQQSKGCKEAGVDSCPYNVRITGKQIRGPTPKF